MLIIPAIDLKDGQCVRLRQGLMEDSTVFGSDPVAFAKKWVDQGARRLHLVDLNGAFVGQPVNGEVVAEIAKAFPDLPIQIGGGIRRIETVEHYLSVGVNYVIIGTQAVKQPSFVREICKLFPGRIMVGLDAKNAYVATDGWANVSQLKATELAARFVDDGVSAIIYTDIARDGMMQGVNVQATVAMAQASSVPIIASGGITNMDDIKALMAQAQHGIAGAISGRAIYEAKLDLSEAQAYCDNYVQA
ncbi:MAG: 1-(5-phosphoribosyl)-5-[(5-phosphoribosylamino)methylideneamino]imidazole-4-carboxamide isomerase [Cellvibrionaceae bacterium]|nr:1-(5-phosphoribosyl)-5-[(5-phosphoribosylamino)methylideneamino]imidazole-4-carboxamide isomerase [Cellvibrionaceae bacterium]